jgi:CRP-like cAMP-binding protein/Fe-S-cluster-containing hydrogenase component 2
MSQQPLTAEDAGVRFEPIVCQPMTRRPGHVELTIDGVPVTAPAGTSILDAARLNGIKIPVLCYQANERPVGVCRMCCVDAGEKTLSAACVKPVEQGMVVQTDSRKVKQARGILLELLLSEHPSPCARQRKTGDCELEALAAAEGLLESRFANRASPRAVDDSSGVISVDHNACILCDRCVRACNEVRHNNVIGRQGKGHLVGIAFDLNDPMGSSSCISCGECLVSCPTGALTNKSVVETVLSAGESVDVQFLKQLPYFEEVSGTFLELNRNSVVVRRYQPGETICHQGEYGSTAFFVLEGQAEIFLESNAGGDHSSVPVKSGLFQKIRSLWSQPAAEPAWRPALIAIDASIDLPMNSRSAELGPGDLFGELSCTHNYPRSATVRAITEVVVLEMLRNVLEMMVQRTDGMRALLDSNYRNQALKEHLRGTRLFNTASEEFLDTLAERAELTRIRKGEVVCRQGTVADSLYLIRAGFVKVTENRPEGEVVLAYLGRGEFFGEVGLLGGGFRTATVTALETTDLVRVSDHDFDEAVQWYAEDWRNMQAVAEEIREQNRRQLTRLKPAAKIDIPLKDFLKQGLMEANSVLLLDLEKCTRCDNCVRACADAHDGVTRLVRDGLRFENYLVATSCRQCRDPLCMIGCPVGSIRRRNSLEVVIEDWCIGCGLCAENCPYGSISMQPVAPVASELQLFPGRSVARRKATSCDLCHGLAEPSCVYACPHDAAHRVDAAQYFGHLAARAVPDSTVI